MQDNISTSHYPRIWCRIFIIAFVFSALLVAIAFSQAPKPNARQLWADQIQLERLIKASAGTDPLGKPLWLESKKVADEIGPRIIHAIMERATKWRDEEGLIFVPVVALLPRKPTLRLLREYQKSKRQSDQVWSREFLTELDMDDVREGVKAIRKE